MSSTDNYNRAKDIIGKLAPIAYICKEISEKKLIDILKMFCGYHLRAIWSALPVKFKKHPQILERLSCVEHYNLPTDHIHIDGLPPQILNCDLFRSNNEEAEEFSKKKLW